MQHDTTKNRTTQIRGSLSRVFQVETHRDRDRNPWEKRAEPVQLSQERTNDLPDRHWMTATGSHVNFLLVI